MNINNTPLRQLELTINQVTRGLRRTLREAEKFAISPAALEDLELDINPDPSFATLAAAGGPAWMAVQLRCALLRDLVDLSERLHQCATPTPAPAPEPQPEVKASADPAPEVAAEDPYELSDAPLPPPSFNLAELLSLAQFKMPTDLNGDLDEDEEAEDEKDLAVSSSSAALGMKERR